jgi:hypothetical protein
MEDTVAIIVDPNSPALVVPRQEAEEVYERYSQLELRHEADQKLFRALVSALNPMPKPALTYGPSEKSFAELKLEEWRSR